MYRPTWPQLYNCHKFEVVTTESMGLRKVDGFFLEFSTSNLGLIWVDLVVYQVPNFYYVWN